MICFNMALFIVAVFLLLTLLVGIYFSRKKTTFREYAVGNKQFATATLVATVLATGWGGGGLIRTVEFVHELGLWWIVFIVSSSCNYWILSRLSLRMGSFMQHFSMAETLGSVYGKYPRIIAALVGICGSIIAITMQITVISQAIRMCVGVVDHPFIPIFSSLLLIFYSTFGGIRAITFTDIFQFITFAIIIPCLAWFMFVEVGKPAAAIVPVLQSTAKFQWSNLFRFNASLMDLLFLMLSSLVGCTSPQLVQRVYMTSGPIQAQRVFSYAAIFNFMIVSFIILVGLFVFVGAPDLPRAEVWSYIMAHIPPVFQGFIAISLLAMAMSTADSCLNSCAIMVSYDIFQSIQNKKAIPDVRQLKIARWTTVVVGLLAMVVAFYCMDLLKLMYWTIYSAVPIVAAPSILAIFGFRGTSRTALIGMATGFITILAWNKWVEPAIGINGSFLAMLANGLAMMAAHYLLKQPEGVGWVGPDDQFKQFQQANARKRVERKEAIKNAWANRKVTLAALMPQHTTMVYIGCYLAITTLLSYFMTPIKQYGSCLILQLFGAAFCLGYPFFYDISKKVRTIPNWFIGACWLIGLALYLPFNLLGHWWHLTDPIFTASLSLAHCAVILWALPLYLGIRVVAATALGAIYPIATRLSFPILSSLFPLLIASLLVDCIVVLLKAKLNRYITQNLYLKNQAKIRASQKLKASLYDAAIVPTTAVSKAQGYGTILTQVVRKIEESISFLDGNMPLYKQDFQSIINKLYDWVAYFNRSEKAKKHALLQPTKITLSKLVRKVEWALSQEVADPPRLLIETITDPNGGLSPHIVCDIHQIVYLLTQAVLRVSKQEGTCAPVVRIELHPTALQFTYADPIESNRPICMLFQATALVVSQATTSHEALPKVKECYEDHMHAMDPQRKETAPPSIDLQQETIATIASAHAGYWEAPSGQKQPTVLLVLPIDVTDILSKMTTTLPIDSLTSETPVTPKEQADSMMALMQFHDHIAQFSHDVDPVDVGTISGLLLLLRKHFGFKRHASGKLFYVRAVGIAELVVKWAFHSPKVIYASLLYELVRRTCLPLSYVKEHYNLGVYAFVWNVLRVDKRQDLDHHSLLYVQNRLKEAIKEDHVQLSVLFIKLAERLYDLRHASGYIHLTEVQHMAQETLAVDVKLAYTYLGPEIGMALEKAAKKALERDTAKDPRKDKAS